MLVVERKRRQEAEDKAAAVGGSTSEHVPSVSATTGENHKEPSKRKSEAVDQGKKKDKVDPPLKQEAPEKRLANLVISVEHFQQTIDFVEPKPDLGSWMCAKYGDQPYTGRLPMADIGEVLGKLPSVVHERKSADMSRAVHALKKNSLEVFNMAEAVARNHETQSSSLQKLFKSAAHWKGMSLKFEGQGKQVTSERDSAKDKAAKLEAEVELLKKKVDESKEKLAPNVEKSRANFMSCVSRSFWWMKRLQTAYAHLHPDLKLTRSSVEMPSACLALKWDNLDSKSQRAALAADFKDGYQEDKLDEEPESIKEDDPQLSTVNEAATNALVS